MGFGDFLKRALNPLSPVNAIKGGIQATKRGDFKGAMKAATLGSLSGGASGNVNEGGGEYTPTDADISHKQEQFKMSQGGDVGSLSPEEIEGLKMGKGSFNGMTGDQLMASKIGKGGGMGMPPPMATPAGPMGSGGTPQMLSAALGAPGGGVGALLRSREGTGGASRFGGIMGGQGGPLQSGLQDIIKGYMEKKQPGGGVTRFGG